MGQARSICLVGHSGCGKTTLAIALMKKAGVKEPIELDASHEEKERKYTIDMGFGTYSADGVTVTLLDTPGSDEFVEEMYKGVPVADLTLLVVNAEKAVEVVTERAWEITGGAKRPLAILVNQMDRENANFAQALESMREHFEGKLLPIQLPIRDGGDFSGIVDLVGNRAVLFADKSKKEIPAELAEEAEEARSQLIEEVSTLNDELMMRFLEDEPISDEELASTLAKGVASGELIPVLCSSASEEKGLDLLSKMFVSLTADGRGNPAGPTRAVVFNLSTDPYLGRLTYVRVLDGKLQEGKHLVDVSSGSRVDVRDLYALEGTKQKRVPEAESGQIVAMGKLDDIPLRTTIAASQEVEAFEMPEFPKPVYSRAIVPKSQADVEKMSEALRDVAGTKATIEVDRDPVTREMIVHGMGDIHLSVFIERLKNRHNVTLETHQPRIPYKETIRKKAEAKYRHKKQTGGRGQFGEVELRIEPYSDGDGYQFLDQIKGASIPGQYIPGVEKGVLEAMEEGNLAKYPVTNVSVAVFDGSYHPVDSSELAFKLAARHAFRDAFDQASPCLLEPVMTVEVRVPEEYTGDIISDLNGRRGRILGMDPAGKVTVVHAVAPLIEMQSYALDLKSRTQGRATFQMDFLKYSQVPGNVQDKIIAQAQPEE
ncbi:MAG: elongation factor G [Candidatus Bipolaricaulia bacterium]